MKTGINKVGGILFCAGFFLAATAADNPSRVQGDWSLNNWTSGDSVRLKLSYRKAATRWEWGNDQPLADLHGLTPGQLRQAHAAVQFTLERDAGTFAFEGTVMLGFGSGEYRFVPNPSFREQLSALGYDVSGEDDRTLMMLAIRDVSLAYAAEVKRLGLGEVAVQDLVRLLDHGAGLPFIRTLKDLGYQDVTANDIIKLKDHGIDPAFIKELLEVRPGPYTVDDIIKLREHGVDPRYVAGIQSAGFKDLTVEQIIKLREHGVD